ncbi:MAG TPA: hypothetical protein VFZ36_09880 [Vicinamibacterales bacterium]
MDHAAYVRVLLSVWVGLGLGQLIQAFNRLARYKGRVDWDWLPLTWAALALLMFVQTWWAYFVILQSPVWANLFAFFLPLCVFIILFLICASALPDVTKTAEGSTVDLRTFYFGQHRYFFGLWAALMVLALVVSFVTRGHLRMSVDAFRAVALIAAIGLAVSSNRLLHTVVTLASLAALITYIVLFSLRLGI